jgi:hypothetical protein
MGRSCLKNRRPLRSVVSMVRLQPCHLSLKSNSANTATKLHQLHPFPQIDSRPPQDAGNFAIVEP